MGHICIRSMGQKLLWGTCGSDLWVRRCCEVDVGKICGAGAAVRLIGVRSMGQELLWLRSMGQEMQCGSCGSDLWSRSCCVADVVLVYGAGADVGQMWV